MPLSISLGFPNCFSSWKTVSVYANCDVSQLKAVCNRARDYLSEFCQSLCHKKSRSSFPSSLTSTEFLSAAAKLSSSTAAGSGRVAYSMLQHLFCYGMDLLDIINLSWSLHSLSSLSLHLFFASTRWENLLTHLALFSRSLSYFLRLEAE